MTTQACLQDRVETNSRNIFIGQGRAKEKKHFYRIGQTEPRDTESHGTHAKHE